MELHGCIDQNTDAAYLRYYHSFRPQRPLLAFIACTELLERPGALVFSAGGESPTSNTLSPNFPSHERSSNTRSLLIVNGPMFLRITDVQYPPYIEGVRRTRQSLTISISGRLAKDRTSIKNHQ